VAHALEIKPKTLQDYRHLINRHVKPRIGGLRLQCRITDHSRACQKLATGQAGPAGN
jgi:hypothetical protein